VTTAEPGPGRLRREPPRFRLLTVQRRVPLSPHLIRVTVGGPELEGLVVELPAASVRLLLPSPGAHELVVPTWAGNEFLLPDGRRPVIRTLTPRHHRPAVLELDVDVVVHRGGVASGWALGAGAGAPLAMSGPGRGYVVDQSAPDHLLLGDETAVPAVSQLLEALAPAAVVQVVLEVTDPAAVLELPAPTRARIDWRVLPAGASPGSELLAAAARAELSPGTRVWAAGEAAGMQRLRRHLFEDRGVPRSRATVRGYWKLGRTADAGSSD
jgi:NADPH-dependent ferric siderophore reductase